ncbi:MAG: ParB N-terminal domain-containing protein [Candidatus Bathyarchaeota archaeon]|nr:ParB N-terminal domain-containing protein [Candidatus Bathyarchaeota archaeon]
MSEFEREIPIPMSERVKISDLKLDTENNPNRMTLAQLDRLKASIKRWGDIVPVVTNCELLVADGQQRITAMKELGMTECSVICLPVKEVDRRLLRQVLNKLRGKHNRELDTADYLRIVEQGEKEDLKALLESVGEKLPMEVDDREISFSVPGTYEIIVECKDEADQKTKFEKLKLEGYKLRILTL